MLDPPVPSTSGSVSQARREPSLTFEAAIGKLKQQAPWLEREYPYAATCLRVGWRVLHYNRRGFSSSLCRALGSTDIIENRLSDPRRVRITMDRRSSAR